MREALAPFAFAPDLLDRALKALGYDSTPRVYELVDLYMMASALRDNVRQLHDGQLPRGVAKRIFLWCAEQWARQEGGPDYGEHEFKNAFYAWEKRERRQQDRARVTRTITTPWT